MFYVVFLFIFRRMFLFHAYYYLLYCNKFSIRNFIKSLLILQAMPQSKRKSRTFRRIHLTTPGGKKKIHYKLPKPGRALCGNCHIILPGIVNERPHTMRNLPKTAKRPERPYGGVLCSPCTRRLLIQKARS